MAKAKRLTAGEKAAKKKKEAKARRRNQARRQARTNRGLQAAGMALPAGASTNPDD